MLNIQEKLEIEKFTIIINVKKIKLLYVVYYTSYCLVLVNGIQITFNRNKENIRKSRAVT